MNAQKVEMYLMINGKYFMPYRIPKIKERLLEADESLWNRIETLNLKDPSTLQIASMLGGTIGVDRFLIGDIGLGVVKLITCGGLGIWNIVDWFLINEACREKNFEEIFFALR